eukprot:340700_1
MSTEKNVEYPVSFVVKLNNANISISELSYLNLPTFDELQKAAFNQLSKYGMTQYTMSKLIDGDEDGYEYESDDGIEYHFNIDNYINKNDIKPLKVKIVLDEQMPSSIQNNNNYNNELSNQSVDEKVNTFMINSDDNSESEHTTQHININKNIFNKQEILYDSKHETALIDTIIVQSLYFHTLPSNEWNEEYEANTKITTHSKIDDESWCYLRAEMKFTKYLNNHSISDYYSYLESGHNEKFYIWDDNAKTNIVWPIDKSHQIMYTKGNAGTYFKTFIGQRDICYMHSRFKKTVYLDNNSYDIIGSLDYSIDENNKYYVKHYNSECTRAIIRYRSYLLIKKNNSNNIKLIYISCFNADPNGNIPKLIIWQYIKHKALDMMHKFINSWDNKINLLKNKRNILYYKNQESKMCILYCINSLLQKQMFTLKMLGGSKLITCIVWSI